MMLYQLQRRIAPLVDRKVDICITLWLTMYSRLIQLIRQTYETVAERMPKISEFVFFIRYSPVQYKLYNMFHNFAQRLVDSDVDWKRKITLPSEKIGRAILDHPDILKNKIASTPTIDGNSLVQPNNNDDDDDSVNDAEEDRIVLRLFCADSNVQNVFDDEYVPDRPENSTKVLFFLEICKKSESFKRILMRIGLN